VVRRARSRFASLTGSQYRDEIPRTPFRARRQRTRGVLFFLPAFLTQSQDMEMSSYRNAHPVPHIHPPPSPNRSISPMPVEKRRYIDEPEQSGYRGHSVSPGPDTQNHCVPRPPYENHSLSHASTRTGSFADISTTGSRRTSREL